jgi:glycosyltransferase involved in cell wall biosynthesis
MRILILNLYFPPDTGATARIIDDVARALAGKHEVTVLAGRPSYDPDERHPYYLLRRENRGGVDVERVGSTAFDRRGMAGRIANFISYLALSCLRALTRQPRSDVIIAMTDPPLVSLVGLITGIIRRAPLVYNIRDLHPDMAVAAGIVQPGLLVRLWERLHRWALKRADLVLVLGEDMRDRIAAKGVSPDNIVVVRDGAMPVDMPSVEDQRIPDEIRNGYRFVLVHAGNIGFAGNWVTLLEAARRLHSYGVGLTFIGDGAARSTLEKMAAGIPNVRFLPYYPSEDIPRVLASADLQVVSLRKGLEGLVVPSKLYPILMAGRPVLAMSSPSSDMARIVRQSGCGMVVDPDDPQGVVASVVRVLSYPDDLTEMGRKAQQASGRFDRRKELERFVGLVEGVASG